MSENNKMVRKRRASLMDECNNNESVSISKEKKRRTMENRLKAQLQSEFTDKIIKTIQPPEGFETSRSGRRINKIESPNNRVYKLMTTEKSVRNKRKVRKVFCIHNIDDNASLRFVSNCQSTALTKSPIQKLISVNKNGLNNDQFQTQLIEKSVNTEPPIIDLCSEISTPDSSGIAQMDEVKKTNDGTESVQIAIDYEQDLKTYHLLKRRTRTESIQIVDEVDLTSSTDGSEGGEDDKPIEPDSTSHFKTDFPEAIQTTDMPTSTTESDAVSMNDKPFSECTSDDCVIADVGDSDSTENWHIGQIVWAALPYFWPAVIFNCEEEDSFRKDNLIHVKFLYDNGRRSWVNTKNAILPFRGHKELMDKCKLESNKRIKAYKFNAGKRWTAAIREANVLQCIKLSNRIDFYVDILMDSVHEMETELRSNRGKVEDRCDTPQTFDTAYSSMKQSVSPNSLSPTLNELDKNYDVDKNINNYLKSVELSRPEDLAEEDLQMDEITSYNAITDSPSTTDSIYNPLAKLVNEKLRADDNLANQNVIANEDKFTTSLNELWTEMKKPTSKRSSRRFSICSMVSNSTVGTPNQTNRQRIIASKKAEAGKPTEVVVYEAEPNNTTKKLTKEQLMLEKQQKLNQKILNCCLKNHPANFLFKGLPKDPVCQRCLESGKIVKCAGKCSGYFHKDCFEKKILEPEYNLFLKRKMLEDDEDNEPVCTVEENFEKLQCLLCSTSEINACLVCSKFDTDCIQCCDKNCGKAFHIECLKYWQQYKIQYANNEIKSFYCPRHACHTCISPDIKSLCHTKESDKKLIKCMQCPGTYHRSSECIPAGSELLSETQLICARHQSSKNLKRINIDFCILCSKGGSLICCDACANACHQDCLNVPIGDHYICEECESGRRPLYGEIVWCKYSHHYQWWPALTVPTPCIPERVLMSKKEPNQICVFFFGTHNYGWVSQAQIYLYLKGDGEWKSKKDKEKLKEAMDEAEQWMHNFQELLEKTGKITSLSSKPPRYRKIKTNRVMAKFKESEYNECKCRPDDPAPCSIESNCYNAVLNFECDPELCPAKDKCQNQNFQRGEQFAFQIKMTDSKGWGLFAKEEIPAEKFIIEYMGEVIDSVEFDQRFNRAKANKDDNYYFLTIGQHLYIDAAAYGNEARFINHSCDPNVTPNKWSVFSNRQEQIRIGFFALRKIMPGEEITFDYNWGTKNMKTVKECQCGSKKCRGHI